MSEEALQAETGSMTFNRGFADRLIDRAQRLAIDKDLFAHVANDYLKKHRLLVYELRRNLFFVKHSAGWQVAVWMMPVVIAAEGSAA